MAQHGATAEIAEAIAEMLTAAGLAVDVRRARQVRSLAPYRAVVLGSAVYAGRWRGDALRLLRRRELRDREVWLFSSGPVGEDKGDPEQLERGAGVLEAGPDQPAFVLSGRGPPDG